MSGHHQDPVAGSIAVSTIIVGAAPLTRHCRRCGCTSPVLFREHCGPCGSLEIPGVAHFLGGMLGVMLATRLAARLATAPTTKIQRQPRRHGLSDEAKDAMIANLGAKFGGGHA